MPASYTDNESDDTVNFTIEVTGDTLSREVMVEFYTVRGSAEGTS